MGKTTLLDWAADAAAGEPHRFAVHRLDGGAPDQVAAAVRELPRRAVVEQPADRPRPQLLVLDDVHLLDADTLVELDALVDGLSAVSVVVLTASRPTSPRPGRGGQVLQLPGLTVPQAHSLLVAHGVQRVDPDVLSDLVRLTGGCPLALRELAQTLTTDHLMGRRALPDPLPLGPLGRTSFGAQLHGLTDRTRLAMLVLALGDGCPGAVLVAALARLGLTLPDLDPAVDRHLVRRQHWVLGDPLQRSAIQQLARAEDVRRAHAALADAFEQTDLGRCARHLAAAGEGVDEDVARTLERAARLAQRRGDVAGAATLWQLAADLSPVGPVRLRRLVVAAEGQTACGDLRAAEADLDDLLAAAPAADLTSRALRVRTQLALWSATNSTELARLSADAEQVSAYDSDSAAGVLLNLAVCAQNLGDVPEALRLARRGVELATDGAPARRAFAEAVLGQLTTLITGRAGGLPAQLNDSEVRAHLHGAHPACPAMLAQWLLWCERYEDADALVRTQLRLARESSLSAVLPLPLALAADIAWWRGRWDDGRASAAAAVAAAEPAGQVGLLGYAHSWDAMYAAQRQDRDRAARALGQADDVAERTGSAPAALCTLWVRLHIALADGDLHAAVDHGARAERLRRRLSTSSITFIPFLPEYVEAAIRVQAGDVAALLTQLAEFGLTNESAWTRAAWLRCSGLAGQRNWQDSFEESLSLTPLGRTPFEHARILGCWGERLLSDGHRREARRLLLRADSVFADLGSSLWRAQISRPLAEAGIEVSPSGRVATTLTERELGVCLLVAGGATNRSAAKALSLSEKTVEYHLGKAMAKTGAANRTQLARLLDEGGLDQRAGRPGGG
ncbi:LuxR C-terminal-related transcriptional regulator [Angustibacter sp. McL0619]|uniref:helix-turn-helix transcriptional regulator n=1 Tax=Angustibacter sp. McL0619 TaxID=3415676 RepID=UPI003CF269FD